MKTPLLIFIIFGCHAVLANKCARPNLSQEKLYVYSNIGQMSVQVSRCNFKNAKEVYSDISDNCIKAFESGIFIDKWSERNVLAAENTPVVIEAYIAKADLTKNEIYLKSGQICRYDRGFCYDPLQGNTYAVVWKIVDRTKIECASQLFQLFEGDVDIWEFQPQGLTYLFYYDDYQDKAFYLNLKTKGSCQDNDVWYTEDGYIVSKKPLKSKNIEVNAALKMKSGRKGVKGGVKGGRITYMPENQNYFYLRPKSVVSEIILKNCEILSLGMEAITNNIDSSYLENPQNLRLILKRYYDLIISTRENILTKIKCGSTKNVTLNLEHQFTELSESFKNATDNIKEIENTLETAGNLEGIREDVDTLADQISTYLKKNGEFDKLLKELSSDVNNNSKNINNNDLEIKTLSEKSEVLERIVNNKLPDLITKSETYDKINQIEQEFHNKVKELIMNVTLLLLQNESSNGVKGKGTTTAEIESMILDKLSSFNLDQQQAAIDALKEKTELLINSLRSETNNNASISENKVMKKLDSVASQNQLITDKITNIEKNVDTLNKTINELKTDIDNNDKHFDDIIKKFEVQINDIMENSSYIELVIADLREDLGNLSRKEVDFNPIYEKMDKSLEKELKQRDERLDSLDDITAKLTEYSEKSTSDIDSLQQQINDTNESLNNFNDMKENVTDNIEKAVSPVNKKLVDMNEILEDHSKKYDTVQNSLDNIEKEIVIGLDNLKTNFSDVINQLNSTLEDNSVAVVKLSEQDNRINNVIDNLKNDLESQGQSINNLESVLQQEINQCQVTSNNTSGMIDNLKDNVTELYEAIKLHEGSILELIKGFEKVSLQSASKSGVKTTKGGVGASGAQVANQERELYYLRTQLTGANIKIKTLENKIQQLETQIEQLFLKSVKLEDILALAIKSVNNDIKGTNERIGLVEFDIKSELALCCKNRRKV
ncbi:paramyosin-like [Diorhabda carinulata]|uniref:paramyosin-like n=1 Tax=Diorhabda carinulata TaxID=1163345 RepID=UPI0025A0EECC|nr:paramyosin-like [Diorhabda carinulata]XP_057663763.1 paramyosin-like [Diorhabda carinulata]